MISLIINLALFFLVLFFLVPAVMVCLMLMRDQHRKQGGWHKEGVGKLAG